MTAPVFDAATIERIQRERPEITTRRGLVDAAYAELAREALGASGFPWCSARPSVLTELGRIAVDSADEARNVASQLEAKPPRNVKAAVHEVRRARNGAGTPDNGQLAVELINLAFRFGDRYPTTTEQQIIEALGLAQRAVMRQREART